MLAPPPDPLVLSPKAQCCCLSSFVIRPQAARINGRLTNVPRKRVTFSLRIWAAGSMSSPSFFAYSNFHDAKIWFHLTGRKIDGLDNKWNGRVWGSCKQQPVAAPLTGWHFFFQKNHLTAKIWIGEISKLKKIFPVNFQRFQTATWSHAIGGSDNHVMLVEKKKLTNSSGRGW